MGMKWKRNERGGGHRCHGIMACLGGQRTICKSQLSSSTRWVLWLNSGLQTWPQAPLPAESSSWPWNFFFFFLESPHHPAAFHSDRLSFIFPPTACIYFYLLFCIWNLFSWIMGFLAVPNTGLIMNLSSQEAKAGQLRIPGLPKLSSKILTWNK